MSYNIYVFASYGIAALILTVLGVASWRSYRQQKVLEVARRIMRKKT